MEKITISTPELRVGDIVLNAGMRILITGPAHVFHGGCDGDYDAAGRGILTAVQCHIGYAWPGQVLNMDEVLAQGVIPRSFMYDSERFTKGAGHGREDFWNVQGNDRARWLVERHSTEA